MTLSSLSALAAALFVAGAGVLSAASESEAAAGRRLVQRYADAIVGVELVVTLKLKQGDREMPPREQRIEVNGTVIAPNGLTITSLAAVDPQSTMEAMRQSGGFRGVEVVGSDFKEVKLRLANGEEVPARFVLKDADLDLAFMAPESGAEGAKREFPHVKLEEATEGTVLGTFFHLARATKSLQRVPLIRLSEVRGLVEKPRRLYLVTEQEMGTPLFDERGAVLGISIQYFANGRHSGMVVLPAADIADMAKQAAGVMAKSAAGAN
jgi:hypothetical protein